MSQIEKKMEMKRGEERRRKMYKIDRMIMGFIVVMFAIMVYIAGQKEYEHREKERIKREYLLQKIMYLELHIDALKEAKK